MRRRRALVCAVATAILAVTMPAAASAAGTANVSIGDATVAEPTDRTGTVTVYLPLTVHGGTATGPVTVDWRTVAESAGTADFVSASGTWTIQSGESGSSIAVQVRADRASESAETFRVEMTSASGATVTDSVGQVSILPTPPGLAIGDSALVEPDTGRTSVALAVTLGAAPKKNVTFGWQLRSATGTVGEDAPAASGTGTVPKGTLGTLVPVWINGDTTLEPDEALELVITSVANASLADGIGRISLRNSDVPPPPPPPFPWQPPSGAIPPTGTVLYVESTQGDWIGQGGTYRYTKTDSVVNVTSTGGRVSVSVDGDEWWDGTFAQPTSNATVQVGFWDNIGRYPFNVPGLDFSGEGRGCNNLVGRFQVDAVSYNADVLQGVTLRFEQRCDTSSGSLRGYLRYDAADESAPPPPGDPADFPWSPPAGAVPDGGDYLYFESTAGDYIGQGRTELYTTADAAIEPDWFGRTVQLFVRENGTTSTWSGDFAGRWNQAQLQPGLYEDVERYPFHNPAKGGLDFSGEGRGCNTLSGDFAVDEITYEGTQLRSVSIRFVQRCEMTGPPLYGALRWTAP